MYRSFLNKLGRIVPLIIGVFIVTTAPLLGAPAVSTTTQTTSQVLFPVAVSLAPTSPTSPIVSKTQNETLGVWLTAASSGPSNLSTFCFDINPADKAITIKNFPNSTVKLFVDQVGGTLSKTPILTTPLVAQHVDGICDLVSLPNRIIMPYKSVMMWRVVVDFGSMALDGASILPLFGLNNSEPRATPAHPRTILKGGRLEVTEKSAHSSNLVFPNQTARTVLTFDAQALHETAMLREARFRITFSSGTTTPVTRSNIVGTTTSVFLVEVDATGVEKPVSSPLYLSSADDNFSIKNITSQIPQNSSKQYALKVGNFWRISYPVYLTFELEHLAGAGKTSAYPLHAAGTPLQSQTLTLTTPRDCTPEEVTIAPATDSPVGIMAEQENFPLAKFSFTTGGCQFTLNNFTIQHFGTNIDVDKISGMGVDAARDVVSTPYFSPDYFCENRPDSQTRQLSSWMNPMKIPPYETGFIVFRGKVAVKPGVPGTGHFELVAINLTTPASLPVATELYTVLNEPTNYVVGYCQPHRPS